MTVVYRSTVYCRCQWFEAFLCASKHLLQPAVQIFVAPGSRSACGPVELMKHEVPPHLLRSEEILEVKGEGARKYSAPWPHSGLVAAWVKNWASPREIKHLPYDITIKISVIVLIGWDNINNIPRYPEFIQCFRSNVSNVFRKNLKLQWRSHRPIFAEWLPKSDLRSPSRA